MGHWIPDLDLDLDSKVKDLDLDLDLWREDLDLDLWREDLDLDLDSDCEDLTTSLQGRSQEFDLGVYVLTILIAISKKNVNVPHVNII